MSAAARLRRLLERGFYPVELPPPFKTRRYGDIAHLIPQLSQYAGATTFYDGATYRGHLRTFGVVNPLNYLFLGRFMADNWRQISEVLNYSKCSGAKPKFPPRAAAGRAITVSSVSAQRIAQRHLASAYPTILSLDINRFYGSVYTHSIPWAVLGKEEAKRRLADRTLDAHWSSELDRFSRNGNQRQTVGIPIGPDTSRIISEMILARIDREMTSSGSGLVSTQIYHNIDDYQIGVLENRQAEDAQSIFVRAIARYELRLNDFKTGLHNGLEFSPKNFQRHFDILRDQSGRNLIEHFFDILYRQIGRNPEANVVGYTLKRFAHIFARNPERGLLREYLQRLIFASPHQARWVFPLLLGIYREVGVSAETRRLIKWGVETCARRNDVGSLLWFLYAAIFLRIRLGQADCSRCIAMSNELVDVMLFHGRDETLFSFDVLRLQERYLTSTLATPSWLVLYEIERRGWDRSPAFQKLGTAADARALYETMRQNAVEFYVADDVFDVSAFDGWNLSQADFRQQSLVPFDWDAIDFGAGFENYE